MNNIEQLKQIIENAVWPTSHVDVSANSCVTYDHNVNYFKPVVNGVVINRDVEVGFLRHVLDIKNQIDLLEKVEQLQQENALLKERKLKVTTELEVTCFNESELAEHDKQTAIKAIEDFCNKLDGHQDLYIENHVTALYLYRDEYISQLKDSNNE